MLEFYPQIKFIHVASVVVSVSLFALRGTLVLAGRSAWALSAPLRYLSYSIDTVLLTAALMLLTMLPSGLFANHWLSVKLALLVVYVILGSLALRGQRRRGWRALLLGLALLCAAAMVSIARVHHPLGALFVLM